MKPSPWVPSGPSVAYRKRNPLLYPNPEDCYQQDENTTDSQIPDAIAERDQTPALDEAVQGETGSDERTRVSFVGYRVRPLDPDNFAGSVKDLLDGLRHANIISGDEPWRITLETKQVKVDHFSEERTVIEIETPP